MNTEEKKNIAITNASESISVGEMKALIYTLKKRQEFFSSIMNSRQEFLSKAEKKFQGVEENVPPEILDKLKLLTSELAKNEEAKFLKEFQEELAYQDDITEFLYKFTGEEQTNYRKGFNEQ